MDKNYTRKELEESKIDELKALAKSLNLKRSGNKNELIDRILQSQQSYLDVLPKDVLNMVEEYKISNNPNNIFLNLILDLLKWDKVDYFKRKENPPPEIITKYLDLRGFSDHVSNFKRLNDFFAVLNIKFIPDKVYNPPSNFKSIEIGKISLIDDKLMIDILITFVKAGLVSMDTLNKILYFENMPFIMINIGKQEKPEYVIIYGGKRILFPYENWYKDR